MKKGRFFLVLFAVLLGFQSRASATGQATLSCNSVDASTIPLPAPTKTSGQLTAREVFPTKTERFLSSFAVAYEIADQPDFYAVTQEVPVPPSQERRSVITLVESPDPYLWKTTLTFSPAQLFLSPADLKLGYSSLLEGRNFFDLGLDPLATESDRLAYFSRRRERDFLARALSTLTISAAVAQRPRREGNRQLPPVIFERDETVETYGVKFDPLPLFLTGSEVSDALSALTAYAKVYGRGDFISGADFCAKSPSLPDSQCLREIAGFSRWDRFAAVALPVFEFKSVDQFDLFNTGDRFLLLPFTEKTLETYTFTWDLKRAFRLGKERAAAVAAVKGFQGLEVSGPVLSVRGRPINIAVDELVYLQITAKEGIKDLVWSVESECAQGGKDVAFPGVSLAGNGLIVGYPEPRLTPCRFVVKAEDAVGRPAYVECTVTPGGS